MSSNIYYLNQNNAPCTLCKSGMGVMSGYPTPPQFFPSQEPIFANSNTNLRQMYRRVYWNSPANSPILNKSIGNINDSYSRLDRIKSKNVGKTAYKIGLPPNALISTKSYTPSIIKTTLNRVRNSI